MAASAGLCVWLREATPELPIWLIGSTPYARLVVLALLSLAALLVLRQVLPRLLALAPRSWRLLGPTRRSGLAGPLARRHHLFFFCVFGERDALIGAHPASRGQAASHLFPLGILRRIAFDTAIVAGTLGIAVVHASRLGQCGLAGAAVAVFGIWLLAFIVCALPCLWACAAPATPPLDDLFLNTRRSERPAMALSLALLDSDLRDRRGPLAWALGGLIGRPRAGFVRTYLAMLLLAMAPSVCWPARLRALLAFRHGTRQRFLHCVGLAHVVLGRDAHAPQELDSLSPNGRFVALYFGHHLFLYVLLLLMSVAVLHFQVGETSNKEGVKLLAIALLTWWAVLIRYTLFPLRREFAELEADSAGIGVFLVASASRAKEQDAFRHLLQGIREQWLKRVLSISSVVLLVSGLAYLQIIGAG